MSRKKKAPKQVKTTDHNDKRANIPTQELSDFMTDEQKLPKKLFYPRDTSLDPQLVWKGKDEQDTQDLEVEARPIYIQEKLHPHQIIENIRIESKKNNELSQLSFFDSFDGIEFEQMVDFYKYPQNWSNRMILGDSLRVMASLTEREGLRGKVQMIYLDPPYGIKFGSNWQVSTRKRNVADGKAEDTTRQPEQVRAFRDTWELGIHSYLAYLRDRLVVARELLTETGSVFIQISDENLHLIRCLLDEVFGSENFVSLISFQKTGGLVSRGLVRTVDYICWYAKNNEHVKINQLFLARQSGDTSLDRYDSVQFPNGDTRRLTKYEKVTGEIPQNSKRCRTIALESANPTFSFVFQGKAYSQRWKTNQLGLKNLEKAGRLIPTKSKLNYLRYVDDFPVVPLTDRWESMQIGTELYYVVQTSVTPIKNCLLMTTDPGDLVLDPTCGSGTTAYVAEQWGRRWITVDTSRVALALARTRLMSSVFPYYTLADSPEGVRLDAEKRGVLPPQPMPSTNNDVRRGFVYKTVPHIMLKHIANNEEIDEIHEKWQPQLEEYRTQLNELLNQSWEEWEIPREPEKDWSQKAKGLLQEYWEHRQARQKEIDESIARNSEQEILYDQPYEVSNVVRVAGKFTVESLSPHRIITDMKDLPNSEQEAKQEVGKFEDMIIDNLRKAGVQNTKKDEKLKFDRLEPYAGIYLHAEGEFTEKNGDVKTVAVCIGPEHGTVGKGLINAAAHESVKGLGFGLLLVCGFSFEANVLEESKQYGRLPVLPVRMNPDLSMGDTLLKKTGKGNLFMVFGEPDLEIKKQKDGKYVVALKGLDIYDPTTGQIRSSSTKDIATWFIDTEYNGQSFFVRHAYFTGGNKPYDKLKRTLRADIDESAWSALYRTESMPFDAPETGRIAVKVINHYGDEVLKVYDVE